MTLPVTVSLERMINADENPFEEKRWFCCHISCLIFIYI